jgi:SAM-dependent methyltransferase
MVKQPYTQMPDLPYLPRVPVYLQACQARTVLDLGCGSGWLSVYLARQGFAVTGLDISEQALNLAQTWSAQERLPIVFDLGDIAEIKYSSNSFDAVVANSIFEHLTYDLAKATIARLYEILNPNGCLIACFDKVGTGPGEYFELPDCTHVYTDKGRQGMLLRCFSDQELLALFENWKIVDFETFDTGSRFIVARK